MTDLGYCRLCAEIKNVATLIVINKNENDSTTNLCDKILQCFQIQILSDDMLPKTLCLDCCTQTNVTYEFYLKVQKAQEFLRNICNPAVNNSDFDFKYNNIQLVKINELANENIVQNNISTNNQNRSKLRSKNEIAEFSDYDNSALQRNNENVEVPEMNSTLDVKNGANNHIKLEEYEEEDSEVKLSKKLETIDEPFDSDNSLSETPEHLNSIEDVQEPVLTTKHGKKVTTNNNKDDSGAKSTKKEIDVWKGIMWPCNKCNNEFETRKDLIYHYENFHNSPPEYKCPECSKCYTKYSTFRQHFGIHRNYQKFSCHICGKAFNTNGHLRGHLDIFHEQNPLAKKVCQICGKAFKTRTSLQYHIKYNHEPVDENSKYECDICKKKITTKSGLKTHRKIHDESTKTHICDQCGLGFRLKSELRNHMNNSHGDIKEENYLQCPLCPKKLKHKIQLQRHHRQIHADKRFECETCGKKFSILTKYTIHLRLHTGEQPFECQYCDKRFRQKPALENHIRQHTGEKPYCCTDCKHYFTDFSNYIKHMKRKHGVTSFKNVKKLKT